jgi:hypothetical protein
MKAHKTFAVQEPQMNLANKLKLQLKQLLPHSQQPAARRIYKRCCSVLYGNNLSKLAEVFDTDKEKKGEHSYARCYESHFARLRRRRLNVLEIGIGGYADPQQGGNSLRMWKSYFPKSNIYGIDICDKSPHNEHRIKTFQGSQVDEAFLRHVASQIGRIDLIIDDGSHVSEHVIATFKILFPLLSENGIYAVEDLQTSYWDHADWGGSKDLSAPHTSMNFLKSLTDGLNHTEFTAPMYSPTYTDKHIVSMHFYHNLVFIHKGNQNDFADSALE